MVAEQNKSMYFLSGSDPSDQKFDKLLMSIDDN